MINGLLGRKIGMTQIFAESGMVVPVTVIEAGPCIVTQLKTQATDGYEAVQIGFGTAKRATRPMLGHLGHSLPQLEAQRKAQQRKRAQAREAARARGESAVEATTEAQAEEAEAGSSARTPGERGQGRKRGRQGGGLGPFQVLREVEPLGDEPMTIGQVFDAGIFAVGEEVDVIGTSKGKGFAGVMKRHGFHGGQRTHGQSDRMRAPGSIGAGTTPGRVLKGTRMAGRMGHARRTVKALEVVQADPSRNLVLVKGSIPGPNGGIVLIRKQQER
jgi:large subunit ribosomal protein L3